MSLSTEVTSSETLSENQKDALIQLLGDESTAVYQAVRGKILSLGQPVILWLRPLTLSNEPVLRRRAREIIHYLLKLRADDRFLAFCLTEGNELNMEQGAWLLAQTEFPEINIAAYQAVLDSHANELLECVDLRASGEEILAAFNDCLFDTLRFKGNEENYFDPENNYLNRVLDRRKGNPIGLCMVYIMLARRLGLPVTGIGLPGHFICRYQSSSEEYYIDVFNCGKLWTKKNCVEYLQYRNYTVQDEYLMPVNPRRMLLRLCGNLHQVYQHTEKLEHATRLHRYLLALTK